MAGKLVAMSATELDRLEIIRKVVERRLSQVEAGPLLGLTTRQIRRLCRAFGSNGALGLVSRQRGRPSNHQLAPGIQTEALALVREHYADFGPTLAQEKLSELHSIEVSRETLRKWMVAGGLWLTRRDRLPAVHQPRHRRSCLGELVQIDGSDHEWFEARGPRCSLLVYVDDATGRLMELRFAHSESAFDYFAATRSYLARHGRPVAFYSDKHSIFRVAKEHAAGRSDGMTQFGRALAELNIDIICANSPQAKGRVERMNQTLQDRLVKELRLRGISTMEAGNTFLPAFIDDYNQRFARAPRNASDSHRPLRSDDDLDRIFSWQEERTMTRNLVVHFKRSAYLVTPGPDIHALRGEPVRVHEWEDGRIEIHCNGRALPFTSFDKNPQITQGAVVENKRLDSVLAFIQAGQADRDRERLASKTLTLRQKERLRAARANAGAPAVHA